MDNKMNLLEDLPFDLKQVRLRSKVPILRYWNVRLNPLVKYHTSGMAKYYYPAGTMFQCSGLLDYEGEINELAYGLRVSFVMSPKVKKFFWYDLVLDVVGSSNSRITIDAASLFLLFEPVDENGNVISLLTHDGTGSSCMISPEDREKTEREEISEQDKMNDRDETNNREECATLPHWADEDVWGPIVGGIRAGKKPTDILGDVCGSAGKGSGGTSKSGRVGSAKTLGTPRNASPNLNTYPHGVKSKLFPNLLAVCEGDRTLDDVLQYVQKWCENWDAEIRKDSTKGRGYDKEVVIVTDKWDKNVFTSYEEELRRRAMHEDFWFTVYLDTGNGYTEITFPWSGAYDFTRHPAS